MRANHHSPLVKRTFFLGICNGALWQLANAFLSPSTVIPAFVLALGAKKLWIGIIVACFSAGWAWPQVFLSRYLSNKQRLLPYYWLSAIGRTITIISLTLLVAMLSDAPPTVLLLTMAGLFLFYGSCGAIGIIPFHTIVSDSMPASWRGRFFGTRWLVGGILGMLAGLVVNRILDGQFGLEFPRNYVVLFGTASIIFVASVAVFSVVKEPPHQTQTRRLPMRMELARGPRLMRRDRDWRMLVTARIFRDISFGFTFPFMAAFAIEQLMAPASVVGIFLAIQAGAGALSNLIWSRLSDKGGNRRTLIWSSIAGLLPPIIALSSYVIPDTPLGTLFGTAFTLRLAVFCLAFFPLGFTMSGQMMGQTNFLLDIAPNRRRPTYLAFSFLVGFPLAWCPAVAALVIGESRFALGFGLALIAAIATVVTTTRLREPRADELGLNGDAETGPDDDSHRPIAAGG